MDGFGFSFKADFLSHTQTLKNTQEEKERKKERIRKGKFIGLKEKID